MTERKKSALEVAKELYLRFEKGLPVDHFDQLLFVIVESATSSQRERIRRGFPAHVAAVEESAKEVR